jgi:hypothetical protein
MRVVFKIAGAGYGLVYELTPSEGGWSETILYMAQDWNVGSKLANNAKPIASCFNPRAHARGSFNPRVVTPSRFNCWVLGRLEGLRFGLDFGVENGKFDPRSGSQASSFSLCPEFKKNGIFPI